MRVYRFERNGYGPYTCKSPEKVRDKRLNAQIDMHEYDDSDRWPVAWWDGIPLNYAIGCTSVKALVTWFDAMVGSLVRCGFRIRVYDLPEDDVWEGSSGKQVGFDPEAEKVVIR